MAQGQGQGIGGVGRRGFGQTEHGLDHLGDLLLRGGAPAGDILLGAARRILKNRHAGRSSISLKELSTDNFIMFDKVTGLHRLIMDECGKAGFEPTIFYSSHRKVSVFGLVGTNIGLALMPVKIYEYYRPPDVVAIPLQEEIECNIVLVHLKNRKLPNAAITFIEFMEKTLAGSSA